MEEKYFIIDNSGQYFVLLKCTKHDTEKAVANCKNCLTSEGALDIIKISEWLLNNKIKHTVILGKIESIILKQMIKNDVDRALNKVLKEDLLISNMEIEKIMMLSKEIRDSIFW